MELRGSRRAPRFEPIGAAKFADALKFHGLTVGDGVEQRRQEIGRAASEPLLDTRIEFPARLALSPSGDAKFRHHLLVPGPTQPLWRAELCEEPGLRA